MNLSYPQCDARPATTNSKIRSSWCIGIHPSCPLSEFYGNKSLVVKEWWPNPCNFTEGKQINHADKQIPCNQTNTLKDRNIWNMLFLVFKDRKTNTCLQSLQSIGVSFLAECREPSHAIKNPQVSVAIAGWFSIGCDIGVSSISTQKEYLRVWCMVGTHVRACFPQHKWMLGQGYHVRGNRDLLLRSSGGSPGSSHDGLQEGGLAKQP